MTSLNQLGQGETDYRKALALALMRQGIDTSPVQHWTQGAARMAQTLAGAFMANQLQGEQAEGDKFRLSALSQAARPSVAPAATSVQPPLRTSDTGPITDTDIAIKDVADSLGVSPEAVKQVVHVESNFDPQATSPSGTYRGATQIGPATFREAGGRLGGMTQQEYAAAPLAKQLMAYPDYLNHYKFNDQMANRGINVAALPPDQQFGVLQGMQFSPNGQDWKRAFAGGNPNVPTTNTPQASALGSTSVADMSRSRYGQLAAVLSPEQADQADLPAKAQMAQAQYGNGMGVTPAPAPAPRANTPVPQPFSLPPMVQDVISNPGKYSIGIQKAAREMAAALYGKQIDTQKAIETELGKKRVEFSPEISGLRAESERQSAKAKKEGELSPTIRAAEADLVGQKEAAKLKEEFDPDISYKRAIAAGLKKQAENQAELDVKKPQMQAQAERYGSIVTQDIDRILDKVKKETTFSPVTGPTGAAASFVPGTESFNASKLIDSIKANAGFQRLQDMRNASPTGGSLGQVSDYEGRMLQAAIGNLAQSQDQSQFSDNLKRVKNIFLDIINGPGVGSREKLSFVESGVSAGSKSGGGDLLSDARAAIAKGAPRDAVIRRLRQNGIDPGGL